MKAKKVAGRNMFKFSMGYHLLDLFSAQCTTSLSWKNLEKKLWYFKNCFGISLSLEYSSLVLLYLMAS